ncbi:MAG: glycosyltransferase family 39 protein [Anaerolineae bacterium]|nr:glycosyltransferase family 39 protein [Anaerolineae bacterium]
MTIPANELPVWMKRALRRTDWGLLLALAFSLLAGWSFVLQPGFFHQNANENYIFRTAEYARALAEGRLYPRWSAETLAGYGAPIPHYAPPGAGYLPALIQQLYTNDPAQAVRLVYIAAYILAGLSIYALVARRLNAISGLIATLLYVYSPYFALTAPHIIGDLPVVLGLALLPALLWSVDRCVLQNEPIDLLITGGLSAALLMTEPRILAAGVILVGVWLSVQDRQRGLGRWLPFAGIGFGVLIAAIFWLPAVVEGGVVTWLERGQDLRPTISLTGLFAPLRMLDPDAMIPTAQFTFGWASLAAALISVPVIIRRRLALPAIFAVLTVGIIVLLLTFRYQVWLLGIGAFTLAVAGSGLGAARRLRQGRAALTLTLAAILALSFPVWIAPESTELNMDASPEAQRLYEQLGYGIAVLPPDAPLPTTPRGTTLAASSALNGKLAAGQHGGQIGTLAHTTHSDTFQLLLNEPLSLQILTSYFPGWTATFHGDSVRVSPHPEGGLMINLATPDRGELVVELGTTPPRLMGWISTLVTFGLLLLITYWRYRQPHSRYVESDQLSLDEARVGGALLIVLLFALAFLSTGIFNAPNGYGLADSVSVRAQTDTGLELLAYRVDRSGAALDLTLYWRSARFLPDNYQVQVSVIDPLTQATTALAPARHPGGYPTRRWLTNLYVADRYTLSVPPDQPATLSVEVLTSTQAPLTFFASNGLTIGSAMPITLGTD